MIYMAVKRLVPGARCCELRTGRHCGVAVEGEFVIQLRRLARAMKRRMTARW